MFDLINLGLGKGVVLSKFLVKQNNIANVVTCLMDKSFKRGHLVYCYNESDFIVTGIRGITIITFQDTSCFHELIERGLCYD